MQIHKSMCDSNEDSASAENKAIINVAKGSDFRRAVNKFRKSDTISNGRST